MRSARLSRVVETCRAKPIRYWISGVIFAAFGIWGSHILDTTQFWLDFRYRAYVAIQDMRGGEVRRPQITMVEIGDKDYYNGDLESRRPLRRDYLARLVTRLADMKPRLIAIDVDLRSPNPDSSEPDFADYRAEDQQLFQAVCAAAAKNVKIVLSKAITEDGTRYLRADRNIYDGNSQCRIPGPNIGAGDQSLPTDLRRVPLGDVTEDGKPFDSFALAAARLLDPRQYPDAVDVGNLPYGEFHRPGEFNRVNAEDVLTRSFDFSNDIVIIYGDWHVLANNRGLMEIDSHHTPVGITAGAYVHANLIDTLLVASQKYALPEWIGHVLDVMVAGFLAVVFAFPMTLFRKLGAVVGVGAGLFVSSWFFFQVLAVSFDVFPLLAAMGLHAVADQVEEWREEAKEWRAHLEAKGSPKTEGEPAGVAK